MARRLRLVLFCSLIVLAPPAFADGTCVEDANKQNLRSRELQRIVEEDQADRVPPINWDEVVPRDEKRLMRVAEIFAEGCIHSGQDYSAAALIFQHGTVPDHYYQAYLFAKRAIQKGRKEQSLMLANAVDRFLMSKGYKQLFAGQTFRKGPHRCVCLGDTELRFPDKLRKQYSGSFLQDRIDQVLSRNKKNPSCGQRVYCDEKLQSPPKGLFPGIW